MKKASKVDLSASKKKEILKDTTNLFKSKFSETTSFENAKIGIESEFPLVTADGHAASKEVVDDVFQSYIKKGWKPIKDGGTGTIVGVSKIINDYEVVFGTDVGDRIIEIAFPPAHNLHEALSVRNTLLKPIIEEFAKHDTYLLGYGVLPMNKPHRKLMADKGRYHFFERDSGNTYVPHEDGVDLHVFAMTAAAQTHIEVNRNNAIDFLNVSNALSGIFILLGANSSVWLGKIEKDKRRALREWLWATGWPNRPTQTGPLRPIKDFDEYIQHLASFRPQMIKRDGQYLSLLNTEKTFEELLYKKNIEAETVNGEHVSVEIIPDDITFTGGFAWHTARMTAYGTVESRVCCQQPQDAALAMSALSLGLYANLEKAKSLVAEKSFTYWLSVYNKSMIEGFEMEDAETLASKVYAIAEEGLHKRNLKEEIFLQPLQKRIQEKKAPAEEIIQIFLTEGAEGIVKKRKLTA